MRVARSLLVIDQDSCIRCGHCAWSCADVHEDGVSRLVRRGDKMLVDPGGERAGAATTPLLVPNSCQHCKNPSCMIDCPTGAIGRDARGEVFIREDLCTGCGSCAKACPWENIAMAPRPAAAGATTYPIVAVKCDLCKGSGGGPACVASCPTQAIGRIDPSAALVELRPAGRNGPAAPRVLPARTPAWPWASGALLAGLGAATAGAGSWTTGIACGVLVGLLTLYAAAKRVPGPLRRLAARLPLARGLYIGHLSLGALALGVTAAHVGWSAPPASVGGALAIAIAIALGTGAAGALLGAVVPRALSRIERRSLLPEELAARGREIDDKVFAALSGRSELVKKLFVTTLRPYRRSILGPIGLVASRRTLRAEEALLHARLDALTAGKRGGAVAGVDELVRLVVEHRAVRAQRALTWLLRGWVAPHVSATAAALVLLALHVIAVAR
jgi:Fe-S-cluster-containing dehydrogenase component